MFNRSHILIAMLTVIAFVGCFASSRQGWAAADPDESEHENAVVQACSVDDVWIISTRHLACPCGQTAPAPALRFWQRIGMRWCPSTAAEFFASYTESMPMVMYVHGNRMTHRDAIEQGMSVRRHLGSTLAGRRYVIWSWPSEKIPGPLRDAREKAGRADAESFYLASFLAGFPPHGDVSLIGYSFGARTVTGSLQILAGGRVFGNQVNGGQDAFVQPQVILYAAAYPRCWLLPSQRYGLALTQSRGMTSFYNPKDPVLEHYDIVFKPGRPQALGHEGVSSRQLGTAGMLLHQYNVSRSVGFSHSIYRYLDSPSIMTRSRQTILATTLVSSVDG